jgi:hypothetical protein
MTVHPYSVIDIRWRASKPYRVAYWHRDYSQQEILRYLRAMPGSPAHGAGIAIRPENKMVDPKLSAPILSHARRNNIPVTILDPGGNAIDQFLLR